MINLKKIDYNEYYSGPNVMYSSFWEDKENHIYLSVSYVAEERTQAVPATQEKGLSVNARIGDRFTVEVSRISEGNYVYSLPTKKLAEGELDEYLGNLKLAKDLGPQIENVVCKEDMFRFESYFERRGIDITEDFVL